MVATRSRAAPRSRAPPSRLEPSIVKIGGSKKRKSKAARCAARMRATPLHRGHRMPSWPARWSTTRSSWSRSRCSTPGSPRPLLFPGKRQDRGMAVSAQAKHHGGSTDIQIQLSVGMRSGCGASERLIAGALGIAHSARVRGLAYPSEAQRARSTRPEPGGAPSPPKSSSPAARSPGGGWSRCSASRAVARLRGEPGRRGEVRRFVGDCIVLDGGFGFPCPKGETFRVNEI